MEPRLTEFSYGYCVTEELVRATGGFKSAPYFPSLYAEGKKGGGFDVQIGSALFLQFKLSEELTRKSARETRRGVLQPTFYRFWLHRRDRSSQHQMLIDLESLAGNLVYYIAPEFANIASLDEAYNGLGVLTRSALFSPSEIGPLPNDEYHSIAFKEGESVGWFLSEPQHIRIWRSRELIGNALQRPGFVKKTPLDDLEDVGKWLNDLLKHMRGIVEERMGLDASKFNRAQYDDNLRTSGDISYLARTYFGSEFFLFIRMAEP